MDFHQLLQRMQELDQPVPETQMIEEPNEGNEFSGALAAAKAAGQDEFEVDGKKYKVKEDGSFEECGMEPMSMNAPKEDGPPPSMSVNINAQGMDDISDLMQLLTKVNPDMQKPATAPMPSMPPMPAPMPALKMLPDLDSDDGNEPDAEPTMKKDKEEEAFANSMDDSEPETGDVMDVVKDGNDLHKKKDMFKAAAGGDNAMAAESTDIRAQIRAELQRRLAEAKGAK